MPETATTETESEHLRRAIQLAAGGRGAVAPNPLVGAVIVKGDEVLGEGFHARLGDVHAEVAALEDCRERGYDPEGATLVLTLEPCAHHGRQPPCTDAILAAGITRVVIGADDPTEKASGRGPGILRDEGIDVVFAEGGDAAAARLVDQAFRKHARTAKPLVIHKAAMSLDGATAAASGDSRWISGAESRELVHQWRAAAGAIAVGLGTVLADDPLLTARDVGATSQPLRVVFDSTARLPLDSQLVATASDLPVLVVHGPAADAGSVAELERRGVETHAVTSIGGALGELGRRGITSLLLEGGATLAGAFLAAGEIDELRLFIAPILLGGGGRPLYGDGGGERVEDALRPLSTETEPIGADLLVRARLREW